MTIQNYKVKQTGLNIFSELLWWLLIAVFAAMVTLPFYSIIEITFLRVNLVFVLLFAVLFRYTIFLEQTPYLKPLWVRFISVLIVGLLFFQVFKQMQDFFELFDTHDISKFLRAHHLLETPEQVLERFNYFKQAFIFFATGTLIMIVAFSVRNIASLWTKLRSQNR